MKSAITLRIFCDKDDPFSQLQAILFVSHAGGSVSEFIGQQTRVEELAARLVACAEIEILSRTFLYQKAER